MDLRCRFLSCRGVAINSVFTALTWLLKVKGLVPISVSACVVREIILLDVAAK